MHRILTAFSQNLDYYTSLFRAPYLPASSPGIFVGDEGREVGAMTSKKTTAQNLFFICFVHLILQTHGLHISDKFSRKKAISAGGFDPSLLHEMQGRHDPTLHIGDASAPCTNPE